MISGNFRALPPQGTQSFPKLPQFSGFMKPCRFEGEVQNLEVQGVILPEIDGNASTFRIQSGKIHFKQRYVRTEKFLKERKAQTVLSRRVILLRPLSLKANLISIIAGKCRNKCTDAVKLRSAPPPIQIFCISMEACKEDAPPYAIDPVTLDTIGLWDFDR